MSRRTPGSPTIRIDPEVSQTIFRARLILEAPELDPVEPPCTVAS